MSRYSERRLVAWIAVVSVMTALSYASHYLASDSGSTNAVYRYSTAVSGTVQYAILLAVTYAIASVDARELLALRRPASWPRSLGVALVAALVIFAVSAAVSALPIENPGKEQGLIPSHFDSNRALPFAVNAIPIVFLAPLVEELLFRGVGFRLLAGYGRGFAVAAVGLTFGLAHGLLGGLLVLVPFGSVLAYVRMRTNSVFPGMIVHAVFNAVALLAVLRT